jgi:hypothetical protein
MSAITVRLPVLAGIVFFGVLLIGTNTLLVLKNRGLEQQVQVLLSRDFAPVGADLPELSGSDLHGAPLKLDPTYSAPFVLLLFDTNCHICDQNWPAWDRLISDPQVRGHFFLASARRDVPESYLQEHHVPKAMIGIDPLVARAFSLIATPQTILIEGGKIVGTWPGALSDKDITEIKNGLITRLSKAS